MDLRLKVTLNNHNNYFRVFHPCYLVPRFPVPRLTSPRFRLQKIHI